MILAASGSGGGHKKQIPLFIIPLTKSYRKGAKMAE